MQRGKVQERCKSNSLEFSSLEPHHDRELDHLRADPIPHCFAEPIGDNIYNWRVVMNGPSDTPYEGGTFYLDVVFPIEYPFRPPHVRFRTKIYLNSSIVDSRGNIAIHLLTQRWTVRNTQHEVLRRVSSLMYPDYETSTLADVDSFERTARWWTKQYAQ